MNKQEVGFTYVELLIATSVFMIVLLMMIYGVIDFSKVYYKISLRSSVQTTVQSIFNNIEQSIQLGFVTPQYHPPSADSDGIGYFCAGTDEYDFVPGKEAVQSAYALYQVPVTGNACYQPPNQIGPDNPIWKQGNSLLGNNYRLLSFTANQITGTPSEWAVALKIAYTGGGRSGTGDDLLCSPSISPSAAGGCDPSAADLTDYSKSDIICKSGAGSQFCYVTSLQSTVALRGGV